MKRSRVLAEKERKAERALRQWVRRIPDDATLANILIQLAGRSLQQAFYLKALPYLKFQPLPFEDLLPWLKSRRASVDAAL